MRKIHPSFFIALSFALVILFGAVLLHLPISSSQGVATNWVDAYFTANSATCVTGLVSLDTGVHFSLFGLIVIMFLMQIGGLGYMTFSTFGMLVLRKRLFISQKLSMQEALNIHTSSEVLQVMRRIFLVVFGVEGLGALILFLRFLPEMGWKQSLLYGVFHSISAFCNAGFALPANFANLMPYRSDPIICLTITTLIIIGGIGFLAISEILSRKRWSLHTRVAIITTLCLIIGGTLLFMFFERHNPQTIQNLGFGDKIMSSYFQSVTPRTAGFNTLDYGKMFKPTILLTIFLMFIGASPGGTGGGIKTNTFAVIMATVIATIKNSRNTIMFERRIPVETVRRAFTIAILSFGVIFASTFLVSSTEKMDILPAAFEVVSAFGTVGLSMGITPYLSSFSKIVIGLTMFIGRTGPLAILVALTLQQKQEKIEYPKEGISIG